MSMTIEIIKMMSQRKPMNKLLPSLQENNNYNNLELLLMLEDLLFWAIGMEVIIMAMVEEKVLEIEGANMLNQMTQRTLE
jgi:hypothetical protein